MKVNCELCEKEEVKATIIKNNMLIYVCKSCGLKMTKKGFSYQENIKKK